MTEGAALYRLMNWLSPAYPVGAFAYSHGLEWAVEAGDVRDRATLTDWITGILLYGAGRVDGALFAAAWRAAAAGDDDALDAVAARAVAWRGTAEIALETASQGKAFADVTVAAWGHERLAALARRHDGPLSLPVAVAVATAPEVPLADALLAYFTAFAGNLVGAGVRLAPLGQTEAQAAIAALEPVVAEAVRAAMDADIETIGTAAPMTELASMFHETQYTRMFRS
jgi:urease accessory protein